jgi:hypothetical protein
MKYRAKAFLGDVSRVNCGTHMQAEPHTHRRQQIHTPTHPRKEKKPPQIEDMQSPQK